MGGHMKKKSITRTSHTVTIVHIYPTHYRYDDSPLGYLFLAPGDELEVDESVLEWFLSRGKLRGGCCGIPLAKQPHFVLKQLQ